MLALALFVHPSNQSEKETIEDNYTHVLSKGEVVQQKSHFLHFFLFEIECSFLERCNYYISLLY